MALLAAGIMALCLALRVPLLRLIFGQVEPEVMRNSEIYFFYTAISFPFIALYDAGASIFRSQENTRLPMTVSILSNFMNIGGNAVLIWGFHMGVTGAAIPTLASRVFCAAAVLAFSAEKTVCCPCPGIFPDSSGSEGDP